MEKKQNAFSGPFLAFLEWPVFYDISLSSESQGEKGRTCWKYVKYFDRILNISLYFFSAGRCVQSLMSSLRYNCFSIYVSVSFFYSTQLFEPTCLL